MKILILITLLFSRFALADSVKLKVFSSSQERTSVEKYCNDFIQIINERLNILASGATAKAKVTYQTLFWEVGGDLPEYTCEALIDHVPEGIVLKNTTFTKRKYHKKAIQSACAADAEDVKAVNSNWIAVVYTTSNAIANLGKSTCVVDGIEARVK